MQAPPNSYLCLEYGLATSCIVLSGTGHNVDKKYGGDLLPNRQIIICSSIFLAILLTAFWLNNNNNQQMESHLLYMKGINNVNLSEEQGVTSFYPREYVRILPVNDDFTESSPTFP